MLLVTLLFLLQLKGYSCGDLLFMYTLCTVFNMFC